MSREVESVKISIEYEVHDVDKLYEAAKAALEKLSKKAIESGGVDEDVLYAQPLEQLIGRHLHDEHSGEVNLSDCILVILDQLIWDVPGAEMVGTTSGSIR